MEKNCLFAAILFFVANILYLTWGALDLMHTQHMSKDSLRDMDVAFIKSFWEQRNIYKFLELSASMMNAAAWCLLVTPLLQLVWILSVGGRRRIAMHTTITVFVLIACFTEVITLLFELGMSYRTEYMTTHMNLSNWVGTNTNDNIGWRTVEIIMLMYSGLSLWMDAFELLSLFFVLNFIYTSIMYLSRDAAATTYSKENQYLLNFQFGFVFVHFGLFIGLLAGVDFLSQVLRPLAFALFAEIGLILGTINRLVLLPIWLVCLSRQLSTATCSIEIARQQGQQEEFVMVE